MINGVEFKSSAALKRYTKEIIKRNTNTVIDSRYDDFHFLKNLFMYHNNSRRKRIDNINKISFEKNNGIFLYYPDTDDRTDISWNKCCIYAFNKKNTDEYYKTLRNIIKNQIHEYKMSRKIGDFWFSEYSGVLLTTDDEIHIDHMGSTITPFKDLCDEWLSIYEKNSIKFIECTNGIGSTIPEPYFTSWSNFHKNHAKLQVISRYENLSHMKYSDKRY